MVDGSARSTFPDLDLDSVWNDNEYALSAYVDAPPSDALIASVQADLGYRLPTSYVTLMRWRNGGMLSNTCCPAPNRTNVG
ncbi:SMI1/KNR4 family protein [Micromonospora sp. CPCC 205539]